MLRETSQSLPNTKLSPNLLNAISDWPIRRTKKYPIRTSTPAARIVNPHCNTWCGKLPSGDRCRSERSPPDVVALASTYVSYVSGAPLQTSVESCAVSLAASDAGSGAYGSCELPE